MSWLMEREGASSVLWGGYGSNQYVGKSVISPEDDRAYMKAKTDYLLTDY